MKKFTLLAAAALTCGSAFAQGEIHGLKLSDPNAPVEGRNYYKISNMRAMRLDYTSGNIIAANGDSIARDGACIKIDSLLYYFEGVEGYTPEKEGTPVMKDGEQVKIKLTAGKDGNPWMGLSALGGNWWVAFSGQEEVKSPYTEYWWFEDGNDNEKAPNSLYIHNAVVEGVINGDARSVTDLAGYKRSNMSFVDAQMTPSKKRSHRYYLLPVAPAFAKMTELAGGKEVCSWEDSIAAAGIDAEMLARAYAFCKNDSITIKGQPLVEGGSDNNPGDCLDMNNYMNYQIRGVRYDELGDTARNDDNGNPLYYNYGFAGVDRTWTPITDNQSNKNHWVNNGSIFFFEPVSADSAKKAYDAYAGKIVEELVKSAKGQGKAVMNSNVNLIKGWQKLTNVFGEQAMTKLQATINDLQSWDGEGVTTEIKQPSDLDLYVEEVQAIADKKLAEAAQLVGAGCKVYFKNMTAVRDLHDAANGAAEESLNLGNAYISAGGNPTYRENGSVEMIMNPAVYKHGIVPVLEKDEIGTDYSLWTIIPIPGTYRFRLYNEATGEYIRKYQDMADWCSLEMIAEDPNAVSEISWATCKEPEAAAPFSLIGCPDDEDPFEMSDQQFEDWVAITDIEDQDLQNKVRLEASWEVSTTNSVGVTTVETVTANLHRGSASSDYKFINWTWTQNSWLADSNAFHIEGAELGSIDEVAAAEKVANNGIYDLQGRKVAKAGKGLYIINGVKTLCK